MKSRTEMLKKNVETQKGSSRSEKNKIICTKHITNLGNRDIKNDRLAAVHVRGKKRTCCIGN